MKKENNDRKIPSFEKKDYVVLGQIIVFLITIQTFLYFDMFKYYPVSVLFWVASIAVMINGFCTVFRFYKRLYKHFFDSNK